jgi:hypothetical protein
MAAARFEDSSEYDEWLENGGRDGEHEEYYQAWHLRMRREGKV